MFIISFPRQQNSFGRNQTEQWWHCAAAGALANLAEAWDKANEVGVRFSSPWFCPICRAKAMCSKEAFLLT